MTQLNPNKHAVDTLSFALTAYFQSPEVCLSTRRKTLTLWAAAVARYSNLHLRAVRSSLVVTRGNWTDWFLEGIPPCYALTWNTRESALVSGPSPALRYNGNCTLTKSSSSQYLDFKVCLRKNHTAKQFFPLCILFHWGWSERILESRGYWARLTSGKNLSAISRRLNELILGSYFKTSQSPFLGDRVLSPLMC